MLRDCRTARWKVRRDLANRASTVTQQPQDLSAGRIGNRPEDRVALLANYCNHLVTEIVTDRLQMVKAQEFGSQE